MKQCPTTQQMPGPPSSWLRLRSAASSAGKEPRCSQACGRLPLSAFPLRFSLSRACSAASCGGRLPSRPSPLKSSAMTRWSWLQVMPRHAPPALQGLLPSAHDSPGSDAVVVSKSRTLVRKAWRAEAAEKEVEQTAARWQKAAAVCAVARFGGTSKNLSGGQLPDRSRNSCLGQQEGAGRPSRNEAGRRPGFGCSSPSASAASLPSKAPSTPAGHVAASSVSTAPRETARRSMFLWAPGSYTEQLGEAFSHQVLADMRQTKPAASGRSPMDHHEATASRCAAPGSAWARTNNS